MTRKLKSILLPALLAAPLLAFSLQASASEAIIKKARCIACHDVSAKRVGPPYKEVAAKYRDDKAAPAMLFEKVRHGGSGNWGNVPMIPHPADKISDEDLKAAITWILGLK